MIKNIFKKIVVGGLVSAICVGGVSIGTFNVNNSSSTIISYADTIKTTNYSATGKTTANLSVRKGPNTTYSKVGTLVKGAKITIVAKTSNGWYKIKYNSGYGYVSGSYIIITTSKPSESVYSATGKTTVNLSVRKGPDTTYSKTGSLKQGVKVTIVAKTSNGWYKIKYNSGYGYVSSKYVTIVNNEPKFTETSYYATGTCLSNVNVRKGPGTSYSKVAYLYEYDGVYVVAKTSNGWYKILDEDGSFGYVSSKLIELDEVEEIEFDSSIPAYTIANLSVRKGPNTTYTKIGSLSKNTNIEVVGLTSNAWLKIKYNNGYGYVYAEYVDIDEEDFEDALNNLE